MQTLSSVYSNVDNKHMFVYAFIGYGAVIIKQLQYSKTGFFHQNLNFVGHIC